MAKPQLFIITGSNGAGKSTLKQELLPQNFKHLEIFDGDIFIHKKVPNFISSTGVAKKLKNKQMKHLKNISVS